MSIYCITVKHVTFASNFILRYAYFGVSQLFLLLRMKTLFNSFSIIFNCPGDLISHVHDSLQNTQNWKILENNLLYSTQILKHECIIELVDNI